MEPANLIAYRLRKLASDGGDQANMEETMRRLLEMDRAAHFERAADQSKSDSND